MTTKNKLSELDFLKMADTLNQSDQYRVITKYNKPEFYNLENNNDSKSMNKDSKTTINKSILLNWLYLTNRDVPLEALGRFIEDKTNGQYVLVKKNNRDARINSARQVKL